MITQTGFLLSYIKYGDNDAVLNCFTKEKGFQTFFAKGIYSSKNKKKAFLRPLNEISFNFNNKPKAGTLPLISKLEPIENPDFYNNVKANAIVFFVADLLNQILRNESENPQIYHEILFFLNELERENYRSHFIFLIKLLECQGFLPLTGNGKFLNPELGIFSPDFSHHLFSESISEKWKEIINTSKTYDISFKTINKKKFLDSLLVYYHIHFTDFRTPQSLEILQQIFE